MSNLRGQNKSVRSATGGSVSDILEVFKKQMVASTAGDKGKVKNVKNTNKPAKDKGENSSENKNNSINEVEADESAEETKTTEVNYEKSNHDKMHKDLIDNSPNALNKENNETENVGTSTNEPLTNDAISGATHTPISTTTEDTGTL